MSLAELNLKFKYRSNTDLLYEDFYKKCLKESNRYDRAVGYFTSDCLKVIAEGLELFLENEGAIRMVANPCISPEDYEAIQKGYKAKYDVIEQCLLDQLETNEDTIMKDTLNVLAWLIYREKLQFKIAVAQGNAIYHEKFGVFHDDEGNSIAFSGSANETLGGLVKNFEKIDVYSREEDRERILDMEEDFEKLWRNKTNNLEVISFPKAVIDKILSNKSAMYTPMQKKKKIELRQYQLDALEQFEANNWNGILEMATGTGKTITSLLIGNNYKEKFGRIFLIIIVPFEHLMNQWKNNCDELGFPRPLYCNKNKERWRVRLAQKVRDYNAGISKVELAITTYKTAASEEFNELIASIKGRAFMIADECHYFGVKSLQTHRFEEIHAKLGLSATPNRWWDEAGTERIRKFFGETIYEYTLEKAIETGILTQYKYTPILCDLNEEEIEKYKNLSTRILRLFLKKNKLTEDRKKLEALNQERSLLLSKAASKKAILKRIFEKEVVEEVSHTLIYCAPGDITDITKILADLGYRTHRFDSKVKNSDRMKILEAFEKGEIQILVAIKCLDEGVDVPATKKAYFLASTSNPREFVQRRGRVLRKAKGKVFAELYDFIVMPGWADENVFRSIVLKEMPRFAEFSKYAINRYEARDIVKKYLVDYELEYLMDKLPWEVYWEMKEEFENGKAE